MPTDTDSEEGQPVATAPDEEEVLPMSESIASQTTPAEPSESETSKARGSHLRLVTESVGALAQETAPSTPKIEDPSPREPARRDSSPRKPSIQDPSPRELALRDPDLALVEAARNGSQRAFSKLFDRHHGRVHAMCCRLLRDRTEVEDAVQHAFLEAWRCLEKFEGRSKFSTWITRIAIHTCLGIRRKLKRMFFAEDVRPQEASDSDGQWGTAPMAPDEGAVHQARKKAVDEVLQMLSGKKRVVFVLADLEGMTAPEIAEILQIPDATVRTRLFHARKEFAQKVESHPGFSDLFGGAK